MSKDLYDLIGFSAAFVLCLYQWFKIRSLEKRCEYLETRLYAMTGQK